MASTEFDCVTVALSVVDWSAVVVLNSRAVVVNVRGASVVEVLHGVAVVLSGLAAPDFSLCLSVVSVETGCSDEAEGEGDERGVDVAAMERGKESVVAIV